MGKRPDYAAVVYGNLIRQTYKKTPIILGGIEASLRRLAHYDYWSNPVSYTHLEQHSAARIGKSRQICAISGCLRLCTATYPVRNAGLTLLQKESRYSPSAEEIFPLSVRSEQDFAPTGKPQRNPQTTEKEAFSEMPRKGFRIGERVWLIKELSLIHI